jgi:hypothetical protein
MNESHFLVHDFTHEGFAYTIEAIWKSDEQRPCRMTLIKTGADRSEGILALIDINVHGWPGTHSDVEKQKYIEDMFRRIEFMILSGQWKPEPGRSS